MWLENVGAAEVEAENAPSGKYSTFFFLPHARTADEQRELCGLVDENIRCSAIDPTAARRDAAVHVINESNPTWHDYSGATKNSVAIETKQARPLTKEGMGQFIHSRTDWKERVVFRLVWTTVSCWSAIVAFTPKNVTLEPDGNLILYWPVAPKTARADPHCASRFVGMRALGALDTIKLCMAL
ncbi:hypothetical protein TcYC6_0024440 [Trypanosoma cruzi]|nr:hypothetical protein TcYC6_0024440 [Trypanosoma cruzi]